MRIHTFRDTPICSGRRLLNRLYAGRTCTMLAKLTGLLSGKAALTALGIVLVGGAATATTVAATTGHLGPIQTPHIGGANATHTPEGDDAQGVHAHTIS